MINLTAIVKKVEDLRTLGNKLGVEVIVDSQCIIFKHNENVYVKMVLTADGESEDREGLLYIDDTAVPQGKRYIHKADLESLIAIKEEFSQDKNWYVLLDMVFNVRTINPSDAINLIKSLHVEKTTDSKETQEKSQPITKGTKKVEIANETVIYSIQNYLGLEKLISTGKRFYHDINTNTGVLCLRSKNYHHSKKGPDFWFGYHPEQKEQLATYNKSYIAFYLPEDGGLIVLPTSYVDAKLEFLNPTYKDGKLIHWHIHIDKFDGVYLFRIPNKGRENINKHVIRDIKTSSDEQVAAVDNDNVIKITSSKFKSIKK